MFSAKERDYVLSQPLARLATVSPTGQCDADAVGFELEGDAFVIGGRTLAATRKFENVAAGGDKVSLIIDDLASTDPWQPRGIKIHGIGAVESRDGRFGDGEYIVVRPVTAWSWGIEGPVFVDGTFRTHKTRFRVDAEGE
jgi:pyridoxamine 5'-phosphate oxidase family protein